MTNTSTAEFPQQSMFAGAIVFLYEARDSKNLLTVEALKEMKKSDDLILKNADYKKFCLRNYNTELCQGVDANAGSVLANQYGYSGMYAWLVGDDDIDTLTDEIL